MFGEPQAGPSARGMRDCASREVALVLVGEVLKADYFGGRQGKSGDFPSSPGAGGAFLPLIMKKAQEQSAVWVCPRFDGTPGKILWLGFVEISKRETTAELPRGKARLPSTACLADPSCPVFPVAFALLDTLHFH